MAHRAIEDVEDRVGDRVIRRKIIQTDDPQYPIVIKNTFEYKFPKAPGRVDHPGTVRASSDEHPFASLTDNSLRASAIGLRCLLTGAQRPFARAEGLCPSRLASSGMDRDGQPL